MSSYLGFNLNPTATSGQGAYGMVPGQIGLPPSIYQQIQSVVPQISGLTSSAATGIQNDLSGILSPSTEMNIGNYAAARGVSSGQPNSPFSNMIGMGVTGTTTEQLQQQGQSNYLNFLSGVGQTQLNPSLIADIAQSNATLASAPDPQQAALALEQLIMQQRGPQGGYNPMNPAGRGGGFGSNPYSGMGFQTQSGNNYAGAQGGFSTGIGQVYSTGGGTSGTDYGFNDGSTNYGYGNPELGDYATLNALGTGDGWSQFSDMGGGGMF